MMSDKVNEQLSALMDGECATPELALAIRRLGKDYELRDRWQRYHLISDTLKNNLPDTIRTEFSERIRLEIEAESNLSPSVNSGWRNNLPLVGWSAAASVALLLSIGFSGLWSSDVSPENNVAELIPVSQTVKGAVSSTQDLSADNREGDVSNPAEEQESAVWDARLNNYAVSHNSVRGVVPYLYQVSYSSNR